MMPTARAFRNAERPSGVAMGARSARRRRWSVPALLLVLGLALITAPASGAGMGSPQPAPQTSDNLAASTFGGVIETITGEIGPGTNGRRLIDGKSSPTWRAVGPKGTREIVLSFFERRPALIAAVALSVPGGSGGAPKAVEVWTSKQGPKQGYRKVAAVTLDGRNPEPVIGVAPTEAAFVKLRVLSTQKDGPLELGEIRVLEAQRAGYTPLAERHPAIAQWSKSPRRAAQRGIDWLEPQAVNWQTRHKCFGCHIQAQVLMGLAIAQRNHYVVSDDAVSALASFTAGVQEHDGSVNKKEFSVTATQFAGMAFAELDGRAGTKTPALVKAADYLLGQQQPSGEVPADHLEAPIDQGSMMVTGNALTAFDQAARETGAEKYRQAANRALAWISGAQPETTQDTVFQVLALSRFGSPERRRIVNALVEQLKKEQNPDGGWQEARDSKGSNAFATGQALFAFKAAGVSISSPEFQHGVGYLLSTQKEDGAWPSLRSHSRRPSEFAPTMWAVIGLAGSFRESKTGSLQVISNLQPSGQDASPHKNLLIILDASGSMKQRLGKATRMATARKVFKEVLSQIPADYGVGLRVYAHRAKPRSKETCTDTELVVPVGPLDAPRLLAEMEKVQPRGETPLVYSTLKAPDDLKELGGGSVILITDGEESCGGDPGEAARALKAAGLDLKLDIIGFTVAGQKVQAQLAALAASTGGHYYFAGDGDALSRSLATATFRYPFAVFDAAGRAVARGTADGAPVELKPGDYRISVYTGGQELRKERITVQASTDAIVRLVGEGDRLALE